MKPIESYPMEKSFYYVCDRGIIKLTYDLNAFRISTELSMLKYTLLECVCHTNVVDLGQEVDCVERISSPDSNIVSGFFPALFTVSPVSFSSPVIFSCRFLDTTSVAFYHYILISLSLL